MLEIRPLSQSLFCRLNDGKCLVRQSRGGTPWGLHLFPLFTLVPDLPEDYFVDKVSSDTYLLLLLCI